MTIYLWVAIATWKGLRFVKTMLGDQVYPYSHKFIAYPSWPNLTTLLKKPSCSKWGHFSIFFKSELVQRVSNTKCHQLTWLPHILGRHEVDAILVRMVGLEGWGSNLNLYTWHSYLRYFPFLRYSTWSKFLLILKQTTQISHIGTNGLQKSTSLV